MTQPKQEIMNYILTNKTINRFLDNVPVDDKNEFKQYFYLTILEAMENEKKYQKFLQLFYSDDSSQLGRYCTMIINNSRKNKSNYNYKKKLYGKNIQFVTIDNIELIDTAYEEINSKQIINEIVRELHHLNYCDQIMFKLYFGIDPKTNEVTERKTYKEIEQIIGINWQNARNSVIKTQKFLQQKIKL